MSESATEEPREEPLQGGEEAPATQETTGETQEETTTETAAVEQQQEEAPAAESTQQEAEGKTSQPPEGSGVATPAELYESMIADQKAKNEVLVKKVLDTADEVENMELQHLALEQNPKRSEKLMENSQNLKNALASLEWDCYGQGQYNETYVHDRLNLRLGVAQLLDKTVTPQYEKMNQVLATLGEISNDTMVMDQYKSVAVKVRENIAAFEEPFSNSQVNIDVMDHTDFFAACDTVKKASELSLEVLVRQVDTDITAAIGRYAALLKTHSDRYQDEAARVAATSNARLRAIKPEDECDPWEVPPQSKAVTYENPVLQQYEDEESNARVDFEFQDEWYLKQRETVDTILPRAQRVAREVDEEHFTAAMDILDEIIELCEKKGQIIDQATKDTGEKASILLDKLRVQIKGVEEAGREFQELFRARREECQGDMDTLTKFKDDETSKDSKARGTYVQAEQDDLHWFAVNDQRIEEERAKLAEQQKLVAELVLQRRERAANALERKDVELKRSATYKSIHEACADYGEKLAVSLRNFELPEGYNHKMIEFPVQCAAAAEGSTTKQSDMLFSLLRDSVKEAGRYAAANYMAPNFGIVRKEAKAKDLEAKASQARNQREFCMQTKDPHSEKHSEMEQVMLGLAQRESEAATVLHARLDKNWAKFASLRDLAIKLGCPLDAEMPDPVATVTQQIQEHATYVLRGPRMALINMDHTSQQRLVVPEKYFLDDSQFRALEVLPSGDELGSPPPLKFIEN